jgi:hypothetical protein
MFARHTATLTAALILGMAAVAHAQQSTDTTKQITDSLQHARHHGEKMITRDTVKLNRDIAVRDSVRKVLDQDQAAATAEGKKIDSLKLALDKERKATPRDNAAITRTEAALKEAQSRHDQMLDKASREKKREEFAEKTVKRESQAAIQAHKDVRAAHPTSSKKVSATSSKG